MSPRPLYPVCCLAFVLLMSAPVLAAGNVLVPDSPGGGFNLGLTPQAKPSAAAAPSKPADDQAAPPAAAPAPPPSPAMTVAPSNTDTKNLPATPMPAPAPAPAPAGSISGSVNANSVAGNGLHFPTQIIEQPPPPDLSKIPGAKLPPNRLNIDLSPKSAWSQSDLAVISDKLSIPLGQVANLCRLNLNGLANADKTAGLIDTQGAPHSTVNYDGQLQSVMLTAQAICAIGQVPPNAGWLIRSNGKYIVMLGGVQCPTPAAGRNPAGFTITYTGGGASSCVYQ